MSDAMSAQFDMRKPLWQMHLLDGYAGGSALVFRLHHALADGLALVHLLEDMVASPDRPAPVEASEQAAARPGHAFVESLHELAVHPAAVTELLERGVGGAKTVKRLLTLPREAATSLKGPLGTEKRAAWTRPIDLAVLREVAHRNDAKLNDVFAMLVAGGLRRYLNDRGEATDRLELRAVVPVNLRHDDTSSALGNRFGLVFLGLPIGVASPLERLRPIVGSMRALKSGKEAATTYAIMEGMAFAPDAIDDLIVDIFEAKATLVLTSVTGPRNAATFAGHRVRSMIFWVPQAGRLGLGVSVLSYAGEIRVGVVSDAKVVAEPREIVAGIEMELSLLLAEHGGRNA
jgi:WS/DGAT/MGAT family acyltransferase